MVVHHGSVGIARTVNGQCARRVRLGSSAAYHPASTATTGQESTVMLVMMIHTAAQCSKKYYHRRKVRRQHLLSAYQTPCEATSFSSCHGLDALGATRLSCAAVAKTSNASYSTIVRQRTYVTLNEISAAGWLLRSRLQISENRSEIVTLRFFSLRSGSDPGRIKVGFLRFGQIPGQKNFRSVTKSRRR